MAVNSTSSTAAANNIYSSIASKNKGLGGLATGLDTESLVEALTAATRAKISKQQQSKQLLQWKQTAYRSVVNTLTEFRTKYLDSTGANDMRKTNYFSVYKGTASSDAITVKAGATATPGKFEIAAINGLATSKTYTTVGTTFRSELTSDSALSNSTTFTGKTITLRMDSKAASDRVIKLDDLDGIDVTNDADLEAALNKLLVKAYGMDPDYTLSSPTDPGESIIKVSVSGGQITFDSPVSRIDIMSNGKNLNFTTESNRFNTSNTLEEVFGSALVGTGSDGKDLLLRINGKLIEARADESVSKFMSRVNTSTANVKMSFDSVKQQFIISANNTGAGNTLDIEDIQGNAMHNFFGTQSGGVLQSAQISGTSYGYKGDFVGSSLATEGTALSILNNIGTSKSFFLTVDGNQKLVTVAEDAVKYKRYFVAEYYETFIGTPPGDISSLNETALDLLIAQMDTQAATDSRTAELDTAKDTAAQIILGDQLQVAINNAFGWESMYDAKVRVYIESDVLGFRSTDTSGNTLVKINAGVPATDDLLAEIGMSALDNTNNYDSTKATTLKDLGLDGDGALTITVNGVTSSFSYVKDTPAPTTIKDLADALNAQFGTGFAKIQNGRLILNDDNKAIAITDSNATDGVLSKLFGVSGGTFATQADLGDGVARDVQDGKNAEIVIMVNGSAEKMYSTSNTFTINGTDFEVNKEYHDTNPITVDVKVDHTGMVDQLKEFVDDYNNLIKTLSTLVNEDKNADYPPLTDEQRAEMSDEEIKKWENEAKKGILRNDDVLRRIIQGMREMFYSAVDAAGLAPYQIGLETLSLYNKDEDTVDFAKSGLIKLDEDKLLAALETNADAVRTMFTDKNQGLAHRMEAVISSAVDTSSTNRGTLVTLAGTEKSTGNMTSVIGDRISNIDKVISNLKYRLEQEYNRYWKKFSALETAISRMSAQSSWLTENA